MFAAEKGVAGMADEQRMLRARARFMFFLNDGSSHCGCRINGIQREILIP